jgi:VWFA-related protein
MKTIRVFCTALAKARRTVLVLFALLLSVACRAQGAPPGSSVIHVDSRLVVLDVVVTGKDGKPVPGLVKSDFQVLEDGQPQRIRSVEYTTSPDDPASRSRTIFVLDALNNSIEEKNFAKSEIEQYIATLPEILLQPAMLVVVDDDGFRVLIANTRDRDGIQRALHKEPAAFLRHDYEARFRITLNALWQIASANQKSPGRIELIWVGHGFPSMNLTTSDSATAAEMQSTVQSISNALLNARTVVYKIDPAAVGAAQMTASVDNFDATFDDSVAPFADSISFDTLVQQTGGRSFFNRNDIDAEVHNAVTLGGTFYTIAYTPLSTSTEDAAYRHIRVTVDRPNLHATTRLGYFAGVAATATQPDPDKLVDAAILNQLQYTALHISFAGFTRDPTGTTLCELQIEPTDLASNSQLEGVAKVQLLVGAAAYSAAHKPLNYSRHAVLLDSSTASSPAGKISFEVPIHIPADAQSLRFIVLDKASGKIGSLDVASIPQL